MQDALKRQTSVAEQLQLSVGEHGYATTTPADSNLRLLLRTASFSKSLAGFSKSLAGFSKSHSILQQ
jgi:hypothetical protein